MTGIELMEEGVRDLVGYASVSIAFPVSRVLVRAPEVGTLAFCERGIEPSEWKDYDAEPGNHPTCWTQRFDISSWRVISAWRGEQRVGGMVLIQGAPGLDMLEGRHDLALIWDLRVLPTLRGRGIGSVLLKAAEVWANSRGCTFERARTAYHEWQHRQGHGHD